MAEQKTLKRGWVKNAAIVFLLIMLLLTFFSNTILNRSLPEVAVQYAQSGTITAKIRGTGTVAANKSYDVTLAQTRKVEAVAIKVGDTVEFGDVLFVLGDAESDELKQAKEALADLNLQYRKALIDASSADYAKETRAIQNAEKDLQQAIADRDKNYITDAQVEQAKAKVESAKAEVDDLTARVAELQTQLESLGGVVDDSKLTAMEREIEDKEAELKAAKVELDKVKLVHSSAYAAFKTYATQNCGGTQAYQLAAAAEKINAYIEGLDEKEDAEEISYNTGLVAAYTAYSKAESKINTAQTELDRLNEDYDVLVDSDNSSEYNSVNKKLKAAKTALTDADNIYTKAKDALTTATEKQTDYRAALTAVAQAQKTVDDLTFDLSDAKKNDSKTSAKEKLDLQNMQDKASTKQKEVNDLQKDSVGATVTAPMAGVVKSVNVTAGSSSEYNQPLAVIEAADNGYSLSFPVTIEQSKRVKMGDSGEVINYYWGSDIKATLSQIKSDPENPGKNKILVFSLTGEVESGSQYTISIGQQSANYDAIVPNSALRSDSNGDFVLTVTAKSTPLGNRYVATRVDVKILATDDTNSAIAGGLVGNDYVITTSSKPLEPGMQVKLVEN